MRDREKEKEENAREELEQKKRARLEAISTGGRKSSRRKDGLGGNLNATLLQV